MTLPAACLEKWWMQAMQEIKPAIERGPFAFAELLEVMSCSVANTPSLRTDLDA